MFNLFKKKPTISSKIIGIVVSVAIAELAGIIGSIFTTSNIGTWYAYLNKPSFNPPSWVFGPVWTLLYLLMGIAAWLIYQRLKVKGAKSALWVYAVQLVLNSLWSIAFFGLHNPLLGLAVVIALWLLIVKTIFLFEKVSKTAAWLLAPYLAWVSFAMVLNFMLWKLN